MGTMEKIKKNELILIFVFIIQKIYLFLRLNKCNNYKIFKIYIFVFRDVKLLTCNGCVSDEKSRRDNP